MSCESIAERCPNPRLSSSELTISTPMKRGLLIYNPTAGQRDRRAEMKKVSERVKERGLELDQRPDRRAGARHRDRALLPSDRARRRGGLRRRRDDLGGRVRARGLRRAAGDPSRRHVQRPRARAFDSAGSRGRDRAALRRRAAPGALLLANDRPFLLWAGVGLDARIMGRTLPLLKRWLGRAGIFFTVARDSSATSSRAWK